MYTYMCPWCYELKLHFDTVDKFVPECMFDCSSVGPVGKVSGVTNNCLSTTEIDLP